jgi:hypothetical protein
MAAALASGCGSGGSSALTTSSSPHAVLSAARAALRSVPSYHVLGMLDDDFTVDLRVSRTSVVGRVTTEKVTWDVVQDHGRLWFRGAAMWRNSISSDKAATYGDKWVRVTSLNAGFGWASHLVDLQKEMPDEIFRDKPGLRNVGVRTFAGRRVVRLSSPTDLYDVETDAPHLPLRWLEPDEIGPNGAPCGVVLDDFGAPVRVSVPRTTLHY